jgi:hypothetical protein
MERPNPSTLALSRAVPGSARSYGSDRAWSFAKQTNEGGKETRLALLQELNARVVAGAGISPDDLMIQLAEGPGENFSFGQGLAQRAFVSQTR